MPDGPVFPHEDPLVDPLPSRTDKGLAAAEGAARGSGNVGGEDGADQAGTAGTWTTWLRTPRILSSISRLISSS